MTSKTLVLLGYFNAILDAHEGNVVSTERKENLRLEGMLKHFQLANYYRLDYPNIAVWTWTNGDGLRRSYIDRKFGKNSNEASFSCPQFFLSPTPITN